MARSVDDLGIPYPPVFHDWRGGGRVSTGGTASGVEVQMLEPDGTWRVVELTEDDAVLMAASLVRRAGYEGLARRVARKVRGGQDGE